MTEVDVDAESVVLRDARETATRQRALLAASAGRSRVGALVHRLPLLARAATTESAARSGLRYQPVAWTAIIVIAIAWWFPGRDDAADGDALVTAPTPFATTTTTVPAPAPASPSAPAPAVASAPLPAPMASPVATSVPSSPSSPPTSGPPAAAADVPLTVRGHGWASRLAGTGASAAEVPDGALPVANRLGQLDKMSFVRLAGTETVFRLREVDEGAREALGAGLVVACPITDGSWQEAPDQSLDAAPPWDETACVAGVEDDGTWIFDLGAFDVDGDAGFALVPDAGAPADFQVAFATS